MLGTQSLDPVIYSEYIRGKGKMCGLGIRLSSLSQARAQAEEKKQKKTRTLPPPLPSPTIFLQERSLPSLFAVNLLFTNFLPSLCRAKARVAAGKNPAPSSSLPKFIKEITMPVYIFFQSTDLNLWNSSGRQYGGGGGVSDVEFPLAWAILGPIPVSAIIFV